MKLAQLVVVGLYKILHAFKILSVNWGQQETNTHLPHHTHTHTQSKIVVASERERERERERDDCFEITF